MTDAPQITMGLHVFNDVRRRAQALMPGDEGARELYIAMSPPEEIDEGTRRVVLLPAAEDFMRRECPDLCHRWPEVFGAVAYDGAPTLAMIGARVLGRRIAGFASEGAEEFAVLLDSGDVLALTIVGEGADRRLHLHERMRALRPSEVAMADSEAQR